MKTIKTFDTFSEEYVEIKVDDEVALTLEAFEAEDKQDDIAFYKAMKSFEHRWYFNESALFPEEDDYVRDVIAEFLEDNDIEMLREMSEEDIKALAAELFPNIDPMSLAPASEIYENRRKAWKKTYINEFIPRDMAKDKLWELSKTTNKACRDAQRLNEADIAEVEFAYDMQTSHDVPRFEQYEMNDSGSEMWMYAMDFRESAKESYAAKTWSEGQKELAREKRRNEYRGLINPSRFIRLDEKDMIIRHKNYTFEQFEAGIKKLEHQRAEERRKPRFVNVAVDDRDDLDSWFKAMQVK